MSEPSAVTLFRSAGVQDVRVVTGHRAAELAPEILNWSGTGGLQGILVQWEGVAREFEVVDEQILRDMDTPDDYRLLPRLAQQARSNWLN